jgi:hypothetical protein
LLEIDVTRARQLIEEHEAQTGETLSFTGYLALCLARAVNEGQVSAGYPIRCAEPWARLQPGQVSGTGSYYCQYWVENARWWQYACTLIPDPGAAAGYGPQKPSAVPVLMINGTADPQDPPANMSGAQTIWPNGRLLIEPGQAHGIDLRSWLQCDADLVQAFVQRANARQLDASCLTQVTLPALPVQW